MLLCDGSLQIKFIWCHVHHSVLLLIPAPLIFFFSFLVKGAATLVKLVTVPATFYGKELADNPSL